MPTYPHWVEALIAHEVELNPDVQISPLTHDIIQHILSAPPHRVDEGIFGLTLWGDVSEEERSEEIPTTQDRQEFLIETVLQYDAELTVDTLECLHEYAAFFVQGCSMAQIIQGEHSQIPEGDDPETGEEEVNG